MTWRNSTTVIFLIIVLAGPLLAAHDPMKTDVGNILAPPGIVHWLGTDALGRDVFSRFLHGGQRTILVSVLGSTLAIVPAILLSLLMVGSSHDTVRHVLDIVIHAMLALPGILVALVILTLSGSGPAQIATAIGVGQLASCTRLFSRALTALGNEDYVSVAKALGASRWHVVRTHLLPNALPEIVAYSVTTLSICTINAISLQFIGFGGEPGIPDWGMMLAEGRAIFLQMPLPGIISGLAIGVFIAVVASAGDEMTAPFH